MMFQELCLCARKWSPEVLESCPLLIRLAQGSHLQSISLIMEFSVTTDKCCVSRIWSPRITSILVIFILLKRLWTPDTDVSVINFTNTVTNVWPGRSLIRDRLHWSCWYTCTTAATWNIAGRSPSPSLLTTPSQYHPCHMSPGTFLHCTGCLHFSILQIQKVESYSTTVIHKMVLPLTIANMC